MPCGGSELIGHGAVYKVDSPKYPKKYPKKKKECTRTFGVVPGTKLTVECSTFRTKGKGGCTEDRVEMVFTAADGTSQSMTFCNRDLDQGGYVAALPQTFAYSVEWKFITEGKKK